VDLEDQLVPQLQARLALLARLEVLADPEDLVRPEALEVQEGRERLWQPWAQRTR
jgi:hypothetical protein